MRAAVVDRFGPPSVVHLAELTTPVPRSGEVLLRVATASVTAADSRIRGARFPKGFGPVARLIFGPFRPRRKVLGSSFSGVVEAVGSDVTGLAVGDEVCGMTGLSMGAHAEMIAVPAKRVVVKPAQVTHDDAAAVLFGGTTALFYLRDKAGVRPGQSVLVNGASGAIGTSAVQLAKHFGATVTAVTSGPNAQLVTGLGADRVIDYTRTPLDQVTEHFDVVLDTVGNVTIASGRRLLNPGGVLLLAVADLWQTISARGDVKSGSAP
ncbi:MAG TPA: NAD(P)-dependent alcohol dehydrogenase, partial [Humibacillus sp.]|nr:NAD(P)-dependent alcohol dehydrogenase [Humibacillus sp.]